MAPKPCSTSRPFGQPDAGYDHPKSATAQKASSEVITRSSWCSNPALRALFCQRGRGSWLSYLACQKRRLYNHCNQRQSIRKI